MWREGSCYTTTSKPFKETNLRVLITGGAGFIGSHLSDAYLQRGDEVFCIDDLSTGSIENIRHLKDHPRFHYTIENVHNQPSRLSWSINSKSSFILRPRSGES